MRDAVEHLQRIAVMLIDYGTDIILLILPLRRQLIVHHLHAERVVALVILRVESLHVGGEAFVEPYIRPVFSLHEVAEPFLPQLMSDQPLAGIILLGACSVERGVRKRRRAHILHAAEDIVFRSEERRVGKEWSSGWGTV